MHRASDATVAEKAARLPISVGLALGVLLTAVVPRLAAQETGGGDGPYERLVIRGATLIDGTGAPPMGPVDIVVHGGMIADIRRVTPLDLAQGTERPRGTRVIEAEGMYVMPGLIDAHTHMGHPDFPPDYIPKLWLSHGITTVRVFSSGGDDPAIALAAAQRAGQDTVLAPRIVLYRFWRGTDPRFWNADGARGIVREWKAAGVDGIKINGKPGLLPDVFHALTDEAARQGMGVAVHIGGDGVAPMHAVAVAGGGATTIEHHYGYAEATFRARTVQDLDPDYDYGDELKRFRAAARVWDLVDHERLYGPVLDTLVTLSTRGAFTMVPTFSVYEDQTDLARARTLPWIERYTLPSLLAAWTPSAEVHGSFYFEWTSSDEAAWGRMFIRWLPWVNAFKNRGGHVAVGSDAGTSYHLYGFGTIRELELLERAGFHPLEVVRSATQESARAVMRDDVGVVRPGYDADLLVLDMNPLEDFKVLYGTGVERVSEDGRATRHRGLRYTILNGRVLDADALLADVERLVEAATAARTDG